MHAWSIVIHIQCSAIDRSVGAPGGDRTGELLRGTVGPGGALSTIMFKEGFVGRRGSYKLGERGTYASDAMNCVFNIYCVSTNSQQISGQKVSVPRPKWALPAVESHHDIQGGCIMIIIPYRS